MSLVCPKDLKPCCDDLCRGSGCLRLCGVEMVELCKGCGHPEDPYFGLCTCDPEYFDDD